MSTRSRIPVEPSSAEKQAWHDRRAAWVAVLEDSAAEWREFAGENIDSAKLRVTREYRQFRDAAARALLAAEDVIDDDTLMTLQAIAWQTKAEFGSEPPIVQLAIAELEARGHSPEIIDLPVWFH